MKIALARLVQWCGIAIAMTVMSATSHAQEFPTKPVQLVVPFPPGGAVDIVGRLVGEKIAAKLGQPVIIENRAGAGTAIGAAYVARSTPDAYTLLISSGSTFTVNPAINQKLPYDPIESFDPIALVARVPLVVVANSRVPFDNVEQLAATVRKAPEKYVYGSFGAGTTGHFAGEQFLRATGLDLVHVPYRGSAPALIDLVGGQIPLAVDTIAASLPHIKSGSIKPIVLMGANRSPLLPGVPTMAEAGYAGFDADSWLAIVAPRGIPAPLKARLEAVIAEVMADPDIETKLTSNGLAVDFRGAAMVTELIAKELPRMRDIAKQSNIKSE